MKDILLLKLSDLWQGHDPDFWPKELQQIFRKQDLQILRQTLHYYGRHFWWWVYLKMPMYLRSEFLLKGKLQPQNLDLNLSSKCWLNFIFQILTEIYFQSFDQNSASKSRPNLSFKTWPKFSLKMPIKIQLKNVDQNPASESWPNFSLKILIKLQLQKLDQTLASKSWPKSSFKILTKLQLQAVDQISALKSWPKINFII